MESVRNKNFPANIHELAINQLLQLSRWSRVYPYLLEQGYSKNIPNRERISKRALVDLDTFVIALLLYNNYVSGNAPYTLRSLAKALDGEDFNSIKSMEKKLKLLFEKISNYKIINTYKDTHIGKRECTRIEPTQTLINFIETQCFKTNS